MFTELPFGNKTVVTEIKGADLLAGLENGFSQIEQGAGRFPQIAGMRVVVDVTKAAGRARPVGRGQRQAARSGRHLQGS